MKRGDRVVYWKDPMLFGVGALVRKQANGRIIVAFESGDLKDPVFEEQFAGDELELEGDWMERTGRPLRIEAAA